MLDNPLSVKGVGYVRRSTDQQGQSIEDQRTAIDAFSVSNGVQIVDYYIDDAISGNAIARPQRISANDRRCVQGTASL